MAQPAVAKPSGGQADADYRRHRGYTLDALSFFVADAQTGFGPFIAGYLTGHGWSTGQIGTVLSVGTVAALLSQLPGGAMVDRLHDKRIAAALSWAALALSAVLFAIAPVLPVVAVAEVIHACATAMLTPAIAALSLSIVGRKALGERLGRNARFAAIGSAGTAFVVGAAGAYVGPASVFWLTAAFVLPGVALLLRLPRSKHGPGAPDTLQRPKKTDWRAWIADLQDLLRHKGVLGFSLCIALFHLGNAALMPIASTVLARTAGAGAPLFVSACVVGPQIIVAVFSPWIGRTEERRGVRLIMVGGFAAVPLRAFLLAGAASLDGQVVPYAIAVAQLLDGVSAAVFGVSLPIMAADLTRGTHRFNLCLGFFGIATTCGATLGTAVAGHAADHLGFPLTFLMLGACGLAAVGSVLFAVREGAGRLSGARAATT
jgi:MFS family permease